MQVHFKSDGTRVINLTATEMRQTEATILTMGGIAETTLNADVKANATAAAAGAQAVLDILGGEEAGPRSQ